MNPYVGKIDFSGKQVNPAIYLYGNIQTASEPWKHPNMHLDTSDLARVLVKRAFLSDSSDEFLIAKGKEAELLIESNARIMGGEPVLKGTRIPINVFQGLLDEGYDAASIVKNVFPQLDLQKIEAIIAYLRSVNIGRRSQFAMR